MYGQQKLKKKINNPAKFKSITKPQAIRIANSEFFQSTFNPGYYQVIKRVSNAESGLRYGSVPGRVE